MFSQYVFFKHISVVLFSECGHGEALSNLPNSTVCHLNSDCDLIDCCVYSSTLDRYITFTFNFDECHNELVLDIESYQQSFSLLDFQYGMNLNALKILLKHLNFNETFSANI